MKNSPAAIHQLGMGHWISQSLYVVAELRVADQLSQGARSTEDLAKSVGAHPQSLYRVLRALASMGIFSEIKPRHFALTPAAEYLRTDVPESMQALASTIGRDWEPWGSMIHSVRTGHSAYEHLYGMNFFNYLQKNPDQAEVFNRAMSNFVINHGVVAISAYDFTPYNKIVDIGGGHGVLMNAILGSSPQLKGVIFDTPQVIAGAEMHISDLGLAERCACVSGDFFDSVPTGGDIYVLASIIHDWDDERSTTIFQNCRKAVSEHGKILIIEMIVPPGDEPSLAKLLDLQMLVSLGGQERTEEQYRDLLSAAGLRLEKVLPTAALPSIIEAVPV